MNHVSPHSHSPAPPHEPPTLLTISEFQTHFSQHIGINTIRNLVRLGRIKSIRLGERKILIPASELTDWPKRELETTS